MQVSNGSLPRTCEIVSAFLLVEPYAKLKQFSVQHCALGGAILSESSTARMILFTNSSRGVFMQPCLRDRFFATHRSLLRMLCLLVSFLLILALAALGVAPISAQTSDPNQPIDSVLGESETSPVYVPLVWTGASVTTTPGIRGQVTLGGHPFASASVTVHECSNTGAISRLVLVATSDAEGRYHIPLTPDGTPHGTPISLTLAFSTATPITVSISPTESVSALGSYTSACMPAGHWPELTLPTVDLQAPVFVAPAEGEEADMPILFVWEGRDHPREEEMLLWQGSVQFDCGDCAPMKIAASPQISTSTMLEWCEIAPYSKSITDAVWVDYTLQVSNTMGTGETLPRRTLVGATVHECPPLP